MNKTRYYQIDILYTIGALLVVLGHSHSSNGATFSGTVLVYLISFIYAFHMPLFFFVAGFLFRNSSKLRRLGYGKWMTDKALKLLTPYVVLSALAFFPKYFFENGSLQGITPLMLLELLFKPRATVWGHFWFLPVLCLVYLLFGLWRKAVKEKYDGVALPVTLAVTAVLYFLPVSTEWLGFNDLKNGAVYFALGMLWQAQQGRIKAMPKWIGLCAICAGLAVTILQLWLLPGKRYGTLVSGCAMIFVCCQVAELIGPRKWAGWISQRNFSIYIYSWLFQAVAMAVCDRMGFAWYLTTAVMFVAGMAGPIIVIVIYEKLPKLHCRFFDLVLGVK